MAELQQRPHSVGGGTPSAAAAAPSAVQETDTALCMMQSALPLPQLTTLQRNHKSRSCGPLGSQFQAGTGALTLGAPSHTYMTCSSGGVAVGRGLRSSGTSSTPSAASTAGLRADRRSGRFSSSRTSHTTDGSGGSNSQPVGATLLSSRQWQQQQWEQTAFGEMLLASPSARHGQQPQVGVEEIARRKQLVPGADCAPCVSQLAAATRPLPVALLKATSTSGTAIHSPQSDRS
jgi:hypothetical protein